MQKKNFVLESILLFSILTIAILFFQNNSVNAQTTTTYCALQTTFNESCLDVPFNQVDTNFNYVQTACASTTFCETGTCVNTETGTCLASPQATCQASQGGVWYSTNPQNTAVCNFGCCLIGDQASYTTKAGCQTLFALYGNGTFNAAITDEATCIASAQPLAKGACVYIGSSGKTCQFITKQTCQSMTAENTTFYQGDLCSNPNLGTNCVPTDQTTCLSGQDQVFFIDSCGNPANVYDATKINPPNTNYWSYVPGVNGVAINLDPTLSVESTTNGNCNYYDGSTCMQYNSQNDPKQPEYGNYICRSLNCNSPSDPFAKLFHDTDGFSQNGGYPQNGETWCGAETSTGVSLEGGTGNPGISGSASSVGIGLDLSTLKTSNLPGSTEVLFTCANGRITTQVDADGRDKICVQNISSSNFANAQFVANEWQDCYYQNSSADCFAAGNCQWIIGASILKDSSGQPLVYDTSQDLLVPKANSSDSRPGASCIPIYTPGFDSSVNSTQTSSQSICGLASYTCYANFEKPPILGGDYKLNNSGSSCVNSDDSLNTTWVGNMETICGSLGDCGIGPNYVGVQGSNTKLTLFQEIINSATGATWNLHSLGIGT